MKRRWTLVSLVILVAVLLCACGRQESPVEDFEYEMVDGEVIITGYKGTDQKIAVPEKIADRPVTKIGDYAFEGYDMVSIDFPDTLKEIGEGAFYRCKCLALVTIPESVEIIGAGAFNSCKELSELKLPDNELFIGEAAFGNCKKLDEQEGEVYPIRTVDRNYTSDGELYSEHVLNYSYQFDRAGRCTSYTVTTEDGQKIEMAYTYDNEGKVLSLIRNEEEVVITYSYDERGNLLVVTYNYSENYPVPYRTTVTTYTYDEDGRILTSTYSIDGDRQSKNEWKYDKWKLVKVSAYANGYEEQKFDWRGRIVQSKSYSNWGLEGIYEYSYDEAGRTTGTRRMDSNGNVEFSSEYFYE